MKPFRLSLLIAVLLLTISTLVNATPASPTTNQACWTAPTTFTNNDPATSTDVLGYYVYFSPVGTAYADTSRVTVSDPTVTCVQTSQFPTALTDGAYTIAVTALGSSGESAYSSNLNMTVTGGTAVIQKKLLNAPGGFVPK